MNDNSLFRNDDFRFTEAVSRARLPASGQIAGPLWKSVYFTEF